MMNHPSFALRIGVLPVVVIAAVTFFFQQPAAAKWRMTGEYPLIAGRWCENEKQGIFVVVHQDGNKFVANCKFTHVKGMEVHWRAEGTISKGGEITAHLVHITPKDFKAQTRTGKLDADGNTLHGHAAWDNGGHDFSWNLKEPHGPGLNPAPNQPHVVSRWNHSANGSPPGVITFWSNGHVNGPNSDITWKLNGNTLTLHWRSLNAVDHCVMAPDGRSYRGKSEAGVEIVGTFVPKPPHADQHQPEPPHADQHQSKPKPSDIAKIRQESSVPKRTSAPKADFRGLKLDESLPSSFENVGTEIGGWERQEDLKHGYDQNFLSSAYPSRYVPEYYTFDPNARYSARDVKTEVWHNPADKLSIGDVKLKYIHYRTYNGKLWQVEIRCDGPDRNEAYRLKMDKNIHARSYEDVSSSLAKTLRATYKGQEGGQVHVRLYEERETKIIIAGSQVGLQIVRERQENEARLQKRREQDLSKHDLRAVKFGEPLPKSFQKVGTEFGSEDGPSHGVIAFISKKSPLYPKDVETETWKNPADKLAIGDITLNSVIYRTFKGKVWQVEILCDKPDELQHLLITHYKDNGTYANVEGTKGVVVSGLRGVGVLIVSASYGHQVAQEMKQQREQKRKHDATEQRNSRKRDL